MASLIAGAGISAIGSLIGSGKQASAIKSAASTEAQSADYAANLTKESADNSLDFTKGNYANAEGYEQPYQEAGTAALSELSSGIAPGGAFDNSNLTSDQVLADDPGYQFRIDQSNLALERAEAAGGGVGSGGALKAATANAQNQASSEYGAAYNRLLESQAQRFGQESSVAGIGTSANATLTNAGTGASSNVANTSLTSAAQEGNDLTSGASATAAGDIGVANTQASSIGSIGTAIQQLLSKYPTTSGSSSSYSNGNADSYANGTLEE